MTAFAHNYVAVKWPADKVSINPNIVTMGEIDTADKDHVIASQGLISMPLDNGLLVSSRYDSSKDSENWTYYTPTEDMSCSATWWTAPPICWRTPCSGCSPL